MKLSKNILFIIVLVIFQPVKTEAGIFKLLMKAGQEAGEAGSKVGRKLDDVMPGLTHLPDEPGVTKVGLDIDADGSISLLQGETKWVLKQGEDISSVLEEIKQSQYLIKGGNSQTIKFYLDPDQLFAVDNRLLKQLDGLNLFTNGKAFPVKMIEGVNPFWRITLRENLHLKANSPEALEEGLWQLNKNLNKANIRLVSFAPDLDDLPLSVQVSPVGKVPDLTFINPDYLENSLNVLRHQTLMVTGKRIGGRLEIKGIKGKSTFVDLNELQAIALKHDINLIILESSKPAQLGTSIFPWNKSAKQANLEKAFSTETYGDFLSSLSGKNKSIFEFEQKDGSFVSFRNSPSKVNNSRSVAPDADVDGVEVAAHITFHVARIIGHTQSHDREMNNRIVSFLPSWVFPSYLFNILTGFLAVRLSRSTFQKIWPIKIREEYRNWLSFAFFRLLRMFFFVFIFLGLFGTIIFLISLLQMLFRIMLWPFRFVAGLFSKA